MKITAEEIKKQKEEFDKQRLEKCIKLLEEIIDDNYEDIVKDDLIDLSIYLDGNYWVTGFLLNYKNKNEVNKHFKSYGFKIEMFHDHIGFFIILNE